MEPKQWLDQVEASMRLAGLPAEHVLRTRTELADHIAEGSDAINQQPMLGQQPKELATELIQVFRDGGFLRRLPPAIGLLAPLLIAVLTPLVYFLACGLLLEYFFDPFETLGKLSDRISGKMLAFYWSEKVIVPCLGVLALQQLIQRMARPWFWAAAMFTMLGLATAATQATLQLQARELRLVVGIDPILQFSQLTQAFLVVGTGAWSVQRQRRVQLAEAAMPGS